MKFWILSLMFSFFGVSVQAQTPLPSGCPNTDGEWICKNLLNATAEDVKLQIVIEVNSYADKSSLYRYQVNRHNEYGVYHSRYIAYIDDRAYNKGESTVVEVQRTLGSYNLTSQCKDNTLTTKTEDTADATNFGTEEHTLKADGTLQITKQETISSSWSERKLHTYKYACTRQ